MEIKNGKERRMGRRSFMALTGGVVSAMSFADLSCALPGRAAQEDFPESPWGGEVGRTNKRVLVAYASMHGSTAEVADTIAGALRRGGALVDVRSVQEVTDLHPYQAAVIGSAIRSDRWLPEAREFVSGNRGILSQIPTAYFLTCLTLALPSQGSLTRAKSFLNPVIDDVPHVQPVSVGLFAGVLDYRKYSMAMKAVMKYKMWTRGIEEGDYRDWQAIRHWADQLNFEVP